MGLGQGLFGWVRRRFTPGRANVVRRRGPIEHFIILDGTMSSLDPGEETNAGLTYRLLHEIGHASLYYEAGVQWDDWWDSAGVITGKGINRQICRAYGYLASRYRAGDRIFLLGYSRGAYAVRSLAGIIDRVGLLRAEHATERNIRQVYRLYQYDPDGAAARAFARAWCHERTVIEMVGAWDTVKALGLRLPLFWRLTEPAHAFHNHDLGAAIRQGYHALALDETRQAFAPVLWETPQGYPGRVEQVWFRGTHGDVGGHINGCSAARPLANIPLVWMLEKLEENGVELPVGWRARFPCDPEAPSVGTWQGLAKFFLLRAPRVVGVDPSEHLHESALGDIGRHAPRAQSSHLFTNS